MAFYAIKCPKCGKWGARSTSNILKYRFSCYTCGKSLQIKSKRRVGFDVKVELINSHNPEAYIKLKNCSKVSLTNFPSFA